MKRTIFLVAVGIMISSHLAFGQQVYRWTDEKGTIHLTDDPALVPEKFRDQIKEREPPKEPAPPAAPKPAKEVPPKGVRPREMPEKPQTKQAPVKQESTPTPRKDLLGHGEDWWRARVKEWNEKLLSAQKNYESAQAEWQNKQKEWEQSKFKPDSLKRKLRAEIQTLEGRMKDLERQVGEAKNMLEKVLPKEAEQSRADPNWLK